VSFLFISHASEDKTEHVRPLVEALVAEGEAVWVDRPGAGRGNLGLDQSYIDRHGIDYLQSGRSWSASIRTALQQAGAVLGCLSKSMLANKAVLQDELAFADVSGKLVTCIIDDLAFSDLARFEHGLLDLSRHQSPRLDCRILQQALQLMSAGEATIGSLPPALYVEWEKVRNLISSINRVRREPRRLTDADVIASTPILTSIPIGPILKIHDVPLEIIHAFGSKLNSADRSESAFAQASTLLRAAFPEGFTERQILLRLGELPPFGTLPADTFWLQAIAAAGLKARRTVAAFLVSPVGAWAIESSGAGDAARSFLSRLSTR